MKKMIKCMTFCLFLTAFVWLGSLIADRERLNEELIRLHIVANSDEAEDQLLKLAVRDAVMKSIHGALENISDVEAAKAYIQDNLPYIQSTAKQTLRALGCEDTVAVSFCREVFDTRKYDTFTLPAGIYDALRIVMGEGEGKNWWCVVFPTLCISASSDEFSDVAAGAGFPDSLQGALKGEKDCEVRFFLLDAIGRLENSFAAE